MKSWLDKSIDAVYRRSSKANVVQGWSIVRDFIPLGIENESDDQTARHSRVACTAVQPLHGKARQTPL